MRSQYKHQENSNIDIFKNKMAPTNELDLNFTFKNSLSPDGFSEIKIRSSA
jgi:hypothetical protein